jgi:hypothetical protein
LQIDLWWRGLNVARDAGTYLYNAPAPWDNSLTTAFLHNSVTVNGRDQMTRTGRFLYLDWINAYRKPLAAGDVTELQRVRGRYRRGGYRHTRIISVHDDDRWQVVDEILPSPWRRLPLTARLHWLLPDWEWEIENEGSKVALRLKSPYGWVTLGIIQESPLEKNEILVSLFRAGEALIGSAASDPTHGWTSPTYGVKIPALSLSISTESQAEIIFHTEFTFP